MCCHRRLQSTARTGRIDGLPPVEPLQQKAKLRIRQGHHATFGTRPGEPTPFQTFGEQAQATVPPVQALEQITTFAPEDKNVAREWVFLQDHLYFGS
ncbi:hypothetical protein CBM2595_A70044 [Cupriavidus taiwanensis]|nr:hypothetical protein CBM2595_A70044 [Cupriavidus taiwanensis]